MIPSPNQIDKDLIKMFSTVENKSLSQTTTPQTIISSDNFVDVSKSVWNRNIEENKAFERGYISGLSINENNKPDTTRFINDLFASIKDNISEEVNKKEPVKEITLVFAAIKQILVLLTDKCVEAQSKIDNEEEKIKIENILAGLHGYLTGYIVSAYRPQLKK